MAVSIKIGFVSETLCQINEVDIPINIYKYTSANMEIQHNLHCCKQWLDQDS